MKVDLKNTYKNILDEKLLEEIDHYGIRRTFEPDDVIMDIGAEITHMPLLLSGAIKVMREDKDLHELLLYYLEVGDTCAMTLNCCLNRNKSKIRAVADDYVELIMIPVTFMDSWLIKYKSWREFVLNNYQTRLDEMLESIDSLAFQNMEERVYKYLRDKAMVSGSPSLRITHAQIARDLNSNRVVISRIMKQLEKNVKIAQRRKTIDVVEFL